MTFELETVTPTGPVFRLARAVDPWAWPSWDQARPDGTFGNRWDDPAGPYRVLYASSTRFGTLIETLSPFRPDLDVVAGLRGIEGDEEPVAAGTIPREWFERRLMGVAEMVGVYADIAAASRTRLANRGPITGFLTSMQRRLSPSSPSEGHLTVPRHLISLPEVAR